MREAVEVGGGGVSKNPSERLEGVRWTGNYGKWTKAHYRFIARPTSKLTLCGLSIRPHSYSMLRIVPAAECRTCIRAANAMRKREEKHK